MVRCNKRQPACSRLLLFLAALLLNTIPVAAIEPAAGVLDSGTRVFLDSGVRYAENVILHLDKKIAPIRVPLDADAHRFQIAAASIESIRGYAGSANTYVDCPVIWDFSTVNVANPGVYPVRGRVMLPAEYKFSPELLEDEGSPWVNTQIYVYREGIRRVIEPSFYLSPSQTHLVAVSSESPNVEKTLDKPFDFMVKLDDFTKVRMDHIWDLGGVNRSVPGVYEAILCLIPPEPDIEIPEEFCRLPVQVLVQEPGKPNLIAIVEYKHYYYMPVILTEMEQDRLQARYQINGGEWIAEDPKQGSVYFNSSTYSEFRFEKQSMKPGNTYAFQVALDDYTSDILELTLSENGFAVTYRKSQGGNRDETGRKEHPLPSIRQPLHKHAASSSNSAGGKKGENGSRPVASNEIYAPKNDNVPLSSFKEDSHDVSAAPEELSYEEVTPVRTVLAGKRLEKLLEYNKENLLFEKHGITVKISASWLAALQLSDTSLLSVVIEPLPPNAFRLELAIDGSPPASLPTFHISMPYAGGEPAEDGLAVFDENGNRLADAAFDTGTGRVAFSISATGTFFVGDHFVQPQSDLLDSLRPEEVQGLESAGGNGARFTGALLLLVFIFFCVSFFALKRKKRL